MLAVHLVALYLLITLVFRAPCILQIAALVFMIAGFIAVAIADGLALSEQWGWWYLKNNGYEAVGVGVVIYAFRLWYVENICQTSWLPFRKPRG